MRVADIVEQWLKQHGYDGLYHEDGDCGCEVDDLFPCSGEMKENCIAGYRWECDGKDCDYCFGEPYEHHFHIGPKRDE